MYVQLLVVLKQSVKAHEALVSFSLTSDPMGAKTSNLGLGVEHSVYIGYF